GRPIDRPSWPHGCVHDLAAASGRQRDAGGNPATHCSNVLTHGYRARTPAMSTFQPSLPTQRKFTAASWLTRLTTQNGTLRLRGRMPNLRRYSSTAAGIVSESPASSI